MGQDADVGLSDVEDGQFKAIRGPQRVAAAEFLAIDRPGLGQLLQVGVGTGNPPRRLPVIEGRVNAPGSTVDVLVQRPQPDQETGGLAVVLDGPQGFLRLGVLSVRLGGRILPLARSTEYDTNVQFSHLSDRLL